MASSLAREPVRLDAAALRRRLPLALEQAVLLQAVECGKERSGFDLKRSSRRLKNALGNRGAVERLQFERPEDEQVEGALDQGQDRVRHA